MRFAGNGNFPMARLNTNREGKCEIPAKNTICLVKFVPQLNGCGFCREYLFDLTTVTAKRMDEKKLYK
jgi:hypothetical protein